MTNKLDEVLTYEEIHVGNSYRIHPACDYFMRGATEVLVTSKTEGYAICKLYNCIGEITPKTLRAHIAYRDLMPVLEW